MKTIMLHGNIAKEAIVEVEESKKNLVFTGETVCYDDLKEFSNTIMSTGFKGDNVIVLRKHHEADAEIFIGQYLRALELLESNIKNLIVSNVKLPEKEGTYSVYVKTTDSREEEPFFLIRNGDNLFMDIDAGAFYLYVADIELLHRKYEL